MSRYAVVLVLAVVVIASSGCVTYLTYKKLDHSPITAGGVALSALCELGAGNAAGVGMAVADEQAGAPGLSLPTWLLIGNATVLALDAIAATALSVIFRDDG